MERYTIMIVGDSGTGKTCLSIIFQCDKFPTGYIPTVCDRYNKCMTFSGKVCDVCLYEDSSKGEDYDYLRPLSYPGTDVFIALYSVESRKSLENLKNRWIPEVRSFLSQAPFVIVANKIELRESGEHKDTVSSAEGYSMAKQMGASYLEISCIRKQGIEDCFTHVLEIAKLNTKKMRRKMKMSSVLIPPLKPPPGPEPVIRAASSTFAEDWLQMLSDPQFHDVKCLLEEGNCCFSHKIVLCSASSFFTQLFLTGFPSDMTDNFNKEDVNSGKVPGIDRVYDSLEGKETTLELSNDIKAHTFARVLEFMYTGVLAVKLNDTEQSELRRLAEIFDISDLVSHCDKVSSNQDDENQPELFSVSNNRKGTAIGEFFKQETFSDINFNVKGCMIPAHRVVVCARNPKVAALVDSTSGDGKSSTEITIPNAGVEDFTAFLEFLYTDQIPLDTSSDMIGLLSLADKYGAHRLVNLCEIHLKKDVENMCEKLEEGEELKAIELLHKFKACKATQMVDWCRHYICHNYSKFEDKEEFHTLDEDDKIFIKQRRWPPGTYDHEMEDFERKLSSISTTAAETKKCIIC